jgi:glycerophosphoryl diester phosphodiesterase
MRVIAHRGASATHHENTIEAFRAAVEQGAGGIELDVRLSADEVLVVHHDAHLADGRLVIELTADELPDMVPTLGQALEVVDDLWVNIEIKNVPDDPDFDDRHTISTAVAGLLAASMIDRDESEGLTLADRFMISSFNVDSVDRIKAIDPAIPAALLAWGQIDPMSLIGRAEAHGFQAIHPHDILVDRGFVARAHDAGLAINVWTVDDIDRIRELADLGVDGVITNDPAAAVEALSSG